ncbi:U32 family peptidase [Thalassospira profundimaris]|nr:U32 family peptidase [Thalassospira profundimaris]
MSMPVNTMPSSALSAPRLVMGPVLFHWQADYLRDFYARIADEADVDVVHVGEVVCAKRMPFFDRDWPDVIERLQRAGKQVVYSTLALVMGDREVGIIRDLAEMPDLLIEANDFSAIGVLAGRPHMVGPYVNIYNEGTLRYMIERGATRIALPWELPESSIANLCAAAPDVELEMQVFGRVPLAISARCYSARANGLHKDGCRYVCGDTPDGMNVDTLDGAPFLAVNGLQTLSGTYLELSAEMADLHRAGINLFRLSPHRCDMVAIATVYRQLLGGLIGPEEAHQAVLDIAGDVNLANGFLHAIPGAELYRIPGQAQPE